MAIDIDIDAPASRLGVIAFWFRHKVQIARCLPHAICSHRNNNNIIA